MMKVMFYVNLCAISDKVMIRDFDRFLRVYSDKEELVYFS